MVKYRKKVLPELSVTTRQPKLPQVEIATEPQEPLEQPEQLELGLQPISGSKYKKGMIMKNCKLCSVCGKSIQKSKKQWFNHWKFVHRIRKQSEMKVLEAGSTPLQPDWVEAPIDCFKETSTLREFFSQSKFHRVGTEAHFSTQVIKLDEINLDENQKVKTEILEDFKAGRRIKRLYRDVAWQVLKEAGIDPLQDWEPAEDRPN